MSFELARIAPHRRLKRRKVVHARRGLKDHARRYQAGEIDREKFKASLLGWINHAAHGDTWGLRSAVLAEAQRVYSRQVGAKHLIDDQGYQITIDISN